MKADRGKGGWLSADQCGSISGDAHNVARVASSTLLKRNDLVGLHFTLDVRRPWRAHPAHGSNGRLLNRY
jgi:hypothetical protein